MLQSLSSGARGLVSNRMPQRQTTTLVAEQATFNLLGFI